jgi:hypothetical protein
VVGLDPDAHLLRVLGVLGDQRMERRDARRALGQPPRNELPTSLVHDVDVVVILGPVVADEDQRNHLLLHLNRHLEQSRDRPGSDLMDQCSPLCGARHPSSAQRATYPPVGTRSRNRDPCLRPKWCSPTDV